MINHSFQMVKEVNDFRAGALLMVLTKLLLVKSTKPRWMAHLVIIMFLTGLDAENEFFGIFFR